MENSEIQRSASFVCPQQLFPVEQHDIMLGKAKLEYRLPLFPLLPRALREQIETPRVYAVKGLCELLNKCSFTIGTIDYIVLPEALTKRRLLKLFIERLTATVVKLKPLIGTDIFIVAQKSDVD